MIEKFTIISGGQTGADRAALDIAIRLKIPHGGWCPRGRIAEDGTIPEDYHLKCPTDANSEETEPNIYSERTKLNVRYADGTLIFVPSDPLPANITDGTNLTISEAKGKNRPHYIVDLSKDQSMDLIVDWITHNQISILNIAGPRESQCSGIYSETFNFLEKLFKYMAQKKCFWSVKFTTQ